MLLSRKRMSVTEISFIRASYHCLATLSLIFIIFKTTKGQHNHNAETKVTERATSTKEIVIS